MYGIWHAWVKPVFPAHSMWARQAHNGTWATAAASNMGVSWIAMLAVQDVMTWSYWKVLNLHGTTLHLSGSKSMRDCKSLMLQCLSVCSMH